MSQTRRALGTTDKLREIFSAKERVLLWNVISNAAADFRSEAGDSKGHEPRIKAQYREQADSADELAALFEGTL